MLATTYAAAQGCAPRRQCGQSDATLWSDMLRPACHAGKQAIRGSWPQRFVTWVPAELSEGPPTMLQLCKDYINPGPGRGQEDGQGDLCRSQGSLWLQASSPWRHQWWLLSLLSLPSPTPQVPGPRPQGRDGSRLAESSTKLVGQGQYCHALQFVLSLERLF